jgi:serine/threonine protein kinase
MIDGHHHLHLIDFGVNYNKKPKHDKISMFTGGANYLSPELIEGKDSDLQSDIFSVGGIIYYMAEGRKPIPGNRQAFRGTTDYTLVGIIEKAMARSLKLRYLNTNKFLHDIELLEVSSEKNSAGEHKRDNPEIPISSDHTSQIMIRNMPENKSKQLEINHQVDKTINSTLNFGAQLFFGILFISAIIIFMYLINNRL